MQWKEIATEKRNKLMDDARSFDDIRNYKLPDTNSVVETLDAICPPEETKITQMNVEELTTAIQQKQLTAVAILTAFARRACLAHQMCNCLSELFLEEALQEAKNLDSTINECGRTVGPLHGIPITFKDSYNISNVPTCIGLVSRVSVNDHKDVANHEEADIVKLARRAGALFFAKSAVPTAVCSCETNSNLIGYTKNARNVNFSAGGSSGGEASLVAARGSAVGFGTDVGGSVRQPASFQGLYGFKPTSSRLPKGGIYDGFAYNRILPSAAGLFGRSLQDIQYVCKSLSAIAKLNEIALEPETHFNREWKSLDSVSESATVFGIFMGSSPCNPSPPITRALQVVMRALNSSNHEIVTVEPPIDQKRTVEVANQLLGADGFQFLYEGVEASGEPYLSTLGGISSFKGQPEPIDVVAARSLCTEAFSIKKAWNKYLDDHGVDIIICPTVERTAWTPDTFDSNTSQPYTSFVNLLDYPAINIPADTIDKAVDQQEKSELLDEFGNANAKYEGSQELHGMPIGVQLIGRHLCEEQLLKAAVVVSSALESYQQQSHVQK